MYWRQRDGHEEADSGHISRSVGKNEIDVRFATAQSHTGTGTLGKCVLGISEFEGSFYLCMQERKNCLPMSKAFLQTTLD